RVVEVEPKAQPLVELLGPVDVGHGNDLDLELHVDLPDSPVAARVVYFGGAHVCLLVWICLPETQWRSERSVAPMKDPCMLPGYTPGSRSCAPGRPLVRPAARALAWVAADGASCSRTGPARGPSRAIQRMRSVGRLDRAPPPRRESVAGSAW